VEAEVGGIGAAETITEPTGHRLASALLQGFSQDVEGWGGGGDHGLTGRGEGMSLPEDWHKVLPGS
jgi:hypothetical protein